MVHKALFSLNDFITVWLVPFTDNYVMLINDMAELSPYYCGRHPNYNTADIILDTDGRDDSFNDR